MRGKTVCAWEKLGDRRPHDGRRPWGLRRFCGCCPVVTSSFFHVPGVVLELLNAPLWSAGSR